MLEEMLKQKTAILGVVVFFLLNYLEKRCHSKVFLAIKERIIPGIDNAIAK